MVPSCALQNNLPSLDSAADDATSFSNHTAARRHSFIQSEGSIISLVPSEEEISTGGGVGVCNALVLLCLLGYRCTLSVWACLILGPSPSHLALPPSLELGNGDACCFESSCTCLNDVAQLFRPCMFPQHLVRWVACCHVS